MVRKTGRATSKRMVPAAPESAKLTGKPRVSGPDTPPVPVAERKAKLTASAIHAERDRKQSARRKPLARRTVLEAVAPAAGSAPRTADARNGKLTSAASATPKARPAEVIAVAATAPDEDADVSSDGPSHGSQKAQLLWQTIGLRRLALLRSRRRVEATERHRDFLERSAAYRAHVERPDALEGMDVTEIAGMTWAIPADVRKPNGLADRILSRGWLPLGTILDTRALAVGTAMIDIGGNVGTTSIPRVVLGDFQVIYALEAEPNNYRALVHNIIANQLEGFVLPDMVAVGATEGDVTMRVAASIGNHALDLRDAASEQETHGSERLISVPGRTLDRWVHEMAIDLNAVSFIKSDTQGWEGHILTGAREVLAHKHITWQLEFWPRGLIKAGFDLQRIYALLAANFTHFIDLQKHVALAPHPIHDLARRLAYLSDRQFTDLLLYNATQDWHLPLSASGNPSVLRAAETRDEIVPRRARPIDKAKANRPSARTKPAGKPAAPRQR